MSASVSKGNKLIGLEEHLDKMAEQKQLTAALTHRINMLVPVRYAGERHLLESQLTARHHGSHMLPLWHLLCCLLLTFDPADRDQEHQRYACSI